MGALPESTVNLLLSGLMGAISGLITIPINAFILGKLKRDEQYYQHRLDLIAKERELLLQHKLEIKRREYDSNEVANLKASVKRLEEKIGLRSE
jgi:hypothetical protein